MTMMIELVEKDFKTAVITRLHMLEKLEEGWDRRVEMWKTEGSSRIKLLEMKTALTEETPRGQTEGVPGTVEER